MAYSYEFFGGVKETQYAKKISEKMDWPFFKYIINKGYLWEKIDKLADINLCQSDSFILVQMAVIDKFQNR